MSAANNNLQSCNNKEVANESKPHVAKANYTNFVHSDFISWAKSETGPEYKPYDQSLFKTENIKKTKVEGEVFVSKTKSPIKQSSFRFNTF
jgi:hypothetical protein